MNKQSDDTQLNNNETSADENTIIAQRRAKLTEWRAQGGAFPNDFKRDVLAACLHASFAEWDNDRLQAEPKQFRVAGRIMLKRIMGKASFIQIQDMSGQLQVYVRRDDLPEGQYTAFKGWDIGDIVGVIGELFRTKTGELSLHAQSIQLLTKSIRPLPEKFHGLADQEIRYRQRYLDLIVNQASRELFKKRSLTITAVRDFLNERQYMEVETPMMQSLPGGAAARPFVTHHNALDRALYLRIAPELYLKRLVVGGFERVFEINRNFRNEGVSTRHNPEFTMLEFYNAYADYVDAMDVTEELIKTVVQRVCNTQQLTYQEHNINFHLPFKRLSLKQAILEYNSNIAPEMLDDANQARVLAEKLGIHLKPIDGLGKIQLEIFEKTVEERLIEPTFITAYPTEVSPLARKNDSDPFITDRFELFIAGRELANGFSELNDPEDQAERFKQQVAHKETGDLEAMPYDEDYINALEFGLPPVAGVGIGIDRLVMLLTDAASIREVLLFPHMRDR
ncbi:MAG: lysine--tRNA ligase [Gammaproteobacteria bacterium]